MRPPLRAAVQVRLRAWHRGFFCDRLARHGRLNQLAAPRAWRSPSGTSDWPCRRGLLREGRADATVILSFCVVRSVWRGKARQLNVSVRMWGRVLPHLRRDAAFSPGTEERVGGPGGGASSPWSPAGGRRNSRTDAFGPPFISTLLVPNSPAPDHPVFRRSFCRGGPPTWYG